MANSLGYGNNIYGFGTYGQVDFFTFPANDAETLRGLRIDLYDKTGYLLYSFFSETKTFPFTKLKYSKILSPQNGSGCNTCEIEMNQDLMDFGVSIDLYDYIEIFKDNNTKPIWAGYFSEIPSETNIENVYSFKLEGFVKAFEVCYINRPDISSPTGLTTIIKDIFQNSILLAIKGIKYNPDKIESAPVVLNSFKMGQTNAKEIMKKLCGVATEYEYGVDAERELFFRKMSTEVSQDLIFASGFNVQKIEIQKGDYGSVKNKIIVNRKASSGSGVTYRGEFNSIASQNVYGIRSENVNIPETVSDADADLYGTGQLYLKSNPQFKASIKDLPISLTLPTECRHFGRLFSHDKWFLDLFMTCESLTNWTTSDGTNLALSLETTTIHEQSGAIKAVASGPSALNDYIEYSLDEQDWETTEKIVFWIYSSRAGQFLQFGFGASAYSENLYDFYIPEANSWQKIEINISGDGIEDVQKVGFKVVNADIGFNFIIDDFRRYFYGRKRYELQLRKIEWNYNTTSHTVNLEFGSLDFPFTAKIAEINSKIKALEQAVKT